MSQTGTGTIVGDASDLVTSPTAGVDEVVAGTRALDSGGSGGGGGGDGGGGTGLWPPEESLKLYLGFSNADLEDDDWFMWHFPESLQLAHALHAHLAFAEDSAGNAGGD